MAPKLPILPILPTLPTLPLLLPSPMAPKLPILPVLPTLPLLLPSPTAQKFLNFTNFTNITHVAAVAYSTNITRDDVLTSMGRASANPTQVQNDLVFRSELIIYKIVMIDSRE